MQEIIVEILVTVLILSLISLVILPVYQKFDQNLTTILSKGGSDSIGNEIYNIERGGDFYGYEIISQIEYFKNDNTFEIKVLNDNGTFLFTDQGYREEIFNISYNDKYKVDTQNMKDGYIEYIKK